MTKHTFTPGPWHVARSPYGKGFQAEVRAAPLRTHMMTHPEPLVCVVRPAVVTHIEANARLISAAPDLLEALEFMVDADGHIDACGNGGEDREDCSPGCCKVARALAKARGE